MPKPSPDPACAPIRERAKPRSTDPIPFWQIPTKRQVSQLNQNLCELLAEKYSTDPEDFAQELSLRLSQQPEPILCDPQTGRVLREHKRNFRLWQQRVYRDLIAKYRKKKRGEKVVPYSDPRWKRAPDGSRSLVRDDCEYEYVDPREIINSALYARHEEDRMNARIDLIRIYDLLREHFPRPILLAAFYVKSPSEAFREVGIRKQDGWELLRECQDDICAWLDDYAKERAE